MTITFDESTGSVRTLRETPSATSPTARLLDAWQVVHVQADALTRETREGHEKALHDHVAEVGSVYTRSSTTELLDSLASRGFSWRDIARFCGVSVPAVQKWRRGQGIQPERRRALADVVATVAVIERRFVADPAAWMETPLLDSTVTPGDLLASGMTAEVVELAEAQDQARIEAILTGYDADWRATRTRQAYSISPDEDGHLAITVER